MQVCRAMGWDLSHWQSLPDIEQEIWLEFEEDRVRRILDFIGSLIDKGLYSAEAAALLRLEMDLA